MVDVSIADGRVIFEVLGLHKLWALRSRIEIPIDAIKDVWHDPVKAKGWWHNLRAPGTSIPGVLSAGTYYHDGKKIFWDVSDAERTIVVDLDDEDYNQLIVEVADPKEAVRVIEEAIAASQEKRSSSQ